MLHIQAYLYDKHWKHQPSVCLAELKFFSAMQGVNTKPNQLLLCNHADTMIWNASLKC